MENIEKIREHFADIWNCEIDHSIFQDRVSEIVEKTVEMVEQEHRWIPVTERLPEYTENCLVWVGVNPLGTEMWMEQRTALFHVPAQRFYVHKSCKEELIGEVVKWMPLPQPPKEGDGK